MLGAKAILAPSPHRLGVLRWRPALPSRPPVHRPAGWKPQQVRQEQLRALDQRRGSAAKRGYNEDWKRLRLQVLADEPLCRFCLEAGRVEAATEVDHIVPIALRPDLRLSRPNLRALCQTCHRRLTASGVQRR